MSFHRILNLHDFEAPARARLPRCIHGFIQGGAEDGTATASNRAAFDRIALVPQVLVDTSNRSTRAQVLGREWAAPFGIAPMGAMGVAARDADRAMARAARRANIPFVLSGAALTRMEAVIAENEDAWFQAYLTVDADRNEELVQRVQASGYRTLVITADVAVAANRENDVRNGYSSPLRPSLRLAMDGLSHPRWLFDTFLRPMMAQGLPHFENFGGERVPMLSRSGLRVHRRDNLSWTALARLRTQWKHRLILKGVLASDDVRRAHALGIDAVVVSNHGGRQLDSAIAPLDALPGLAQAAGDMPLLMDSGVRRGTDVIKALALGASLAMAGRPFLYAAVVGGEAGVALAIELLRREIDRDMALLGCTDFSTLAERIRRV
jgi:L-lactate dehydrogenase (cytochrome)